MGRLLTPENTHTHTHTMCKKSTRPKNRTKFAGISFSNRCVAQEGNEK